MKVVCQLLWDVLNVQVVLVVTVLMDMLLILEIQYVFLAIFHAKLVSGSQLIVLHVSLLLPWPVTIDV